MARIKYSSVVADIRGSVGGVTFSRNANGAYVRNRSKGTNRKSVGQLTVRAIFTALTSGWRNLDPTDIAGWISNAPLYPYKNKVGIASQYTGQQLYMKLNSTLMQSGLPLQQISVSPLTIVPTIQGTYTASQLTALFAMSNYKFLTNGIVPEGQAVAVYATAPLSAGINVAPASAYRKIYVAAAGFDFNTVPSSLLVQSGYEGVFTGNWNGQVSNLGKQIFFKFKDINTVNGQSGKSDFASPTVIST